MKNTPFYMQSQFQFDAMPNEADLPRKFAGIGYSGGLVHDSGESMVIDLSTTSITSPMPLLLQHDHNHVIGSISSANKDNNSLTVSGELFSDIDTFAASVAAKCKRGAAYQMSVGLFDCTRDFIPAGQAVIVNGKNFNSPLTVLRNGNIREVSIVALGADSNTNVTMFSQTNHKGANTMPDQSAEIEKLKAEIVKLKEEAKAANKKFAEQQEAIRTEEVKQLFSACKKDFTADSATPFMSLDSKQFSAISAAMKELTVKAETPPLNPKLFSAQVTDGKADDLIINKTFSIAEAYSLNKKHSQGV